MCAERNRGREEKRERERSHRKEDREKEENAEQDVRDSEEGGTLDVAKLIFRVLLVAGGRA